MPAVDPPAVALATAGATYLIGAHRRDTAAGRGWSSQVAWMLGALTAATAVLIGPIDSRAHESVAWHMLQHVVLISVVAPLAALARPNEVLPWLLPGDRRRRVIRAGRRWSRRIASMPVVPLLAMVAAMWTFHIPAVYDATESSDVLHLIEHALFVGTGWAVWWSLIGTHDRGRHGVGVLVVFLTALSSTALGVALVAARSPLYAIGRGRPVASRLADQQVAGVLMWAFGGVITAASAIALFATWLRAADRRSDPAARRTVRAADFTPVLPVVLTAGLVAIWLMGDRPPAALARADQQQPQPAGIYQRDCAQCHGVDGNGNQHGPSLVDVGAGYADYVLSTGRMPIAAPDDPIERRPPKYDRPTRIALAEYVAELGGAGPAGSAWPIPDLALNEADVPRGGEIYRLNCAACHQAIGSGGALVGRSAPALDQATADQVAEATRAGPFEMPAFGQAALSDDDVRDVTAYVVDVVQKPQDRGGWGIAHLGPVPEGAVAIVIGLGALCLVAVWIERGREEQAE